jgi:catechol 2,3-dioxygenase-like lactoylglutathione lyase family enzyme
MPIKGINHVNLRLTRAQLETVRDFYVDVLGLVDGDRPPFRAFGYWLYCGDQPVVHLIESPTGESAARHRGDVIDHFAFECRDYDEMRRRLDAAGVDYRSRQVPETGVRQLFLSDPAGVGVELQFPKQ